MPVRHTTMLLILALCLGALAEQQPDPLDGRIAGLFEQLGHAEYKQREDAQAALAELGKKHHDLILDRGVAALAKTDDPERSHRLTQVLRNLLVTYRFGGGQAFLGVRLDSQRHPVRVGDEEFFPIRIAGLLPDTPATTNGFQVGDGIVQLDDKPCHLGFEVADLVNYISSLTPGTNMTVVLYSKTQLSTQEVILARRPVLETDPPIEIQKDAFFKEWLKRNLLKVRAAQP